MLKHRAIPRQISLTKLNPNIPALGPDQIVINTKPVSWAPSNLHEPRMALLNNFGAAGSNAALLLEEYHPHCETPQSQRMPMPHVFGLSAKTETALEDLRSCYLHWLQGPDSRNTRFADIAYTTTARRQIYPYRMAVSANHKEELLEKLSNAAIIKTSYSLGQVVFVFSGQGGQYIGMGRSLYETSAVFKSHIDECHAVLIQTGFSGVLQIITPNADGAELTASEGLEAYQAAIFSLEYALAKLWMSWGVVPVAVMGHRLVTALYNRARIIDCRPVALESTPLLSLQVY
jgi:acyl transferase domain-containing protein